MTKRKKARGRAPKKADPVAIQLHIKVKAPKIAGKTIRPSAEILQRAITNWIETGDTGYRGISVDGVVWHNYARGKPPKSALTPSEIEEARQTLRLRDILRARGIEFFRISRLR